MNSIKFLPFEEIDHSNVTVLYRDHHELIAKGKRFVGSGRELRTVGEFGPILVTVLNDCAIGGTVVWGNWVQGPTGPRAVFRYHVPRQASHYFVGFPGLTPETQHYPGYHGEIALDPSDGSIVRLTVLADLNPNDAMSSAGLLVVYKPVEIGGTQYICPTKSVALATVKTVIQALSDAVPVDSDPSTASSDSLGDPKNYLNEVRFTDYHIFRSESRILAEDNLPYAKSPVPVPSNAPSETATVEDLRSEADGLNRTHGARLNVADFEEMLSRAKTDQIPGDQLVRTLSAIQLTEKLSSAALERLEAEYSSPVIRPALIAVADASALLAPPASDIPMTPAPDAADQASLLSRAMGFARKSASQMANLAVIRETIRFEDTPAAGKRPYQPLQKVGNSTISIVFRNGHENIDDARGYKAKDNDSEMSMPEFGFMLSTVFADAAQSEIDWDHWELSATGTDAVFSYEVSEGRSHFFHFASPAIVIGPTPGSDTTQTVEHDPGYHGEIWVSPADGTIHRLTVIADSITPGPVARAGYVVEYGPAKIGGASYFFPVKGVVIELRAYNGTILAENGDGAKSGELGKVQKGFLDDVTYKKYRAISAEGKQ